MQKAVSSVLLNYDELCQELGKLITDPPELYTIPSGLSVPADWFVDKGIRAQKLAKFVEAYRYRLLDFLGFYGFCDIKYRKKSYIPVRFEEGKKIRAAKIPAAVLFLKEEVRG